MTIEEVLEKLMKAFDEAGWDRTEFALSMYRADCRRVLSDAERLGIRFS